MTVYTMDELAAASGLSTERLQKIDEEHGELESLAEAVLLEDGDSSGSTNSSGGRTGSGSDVSLSANTRKVAQAHGLPMNWAALDGIDLPPSLADVAMSDRGLAAAINKAHGVEGPGDRVVTASLIGNVRDKGVERGPTGVQVEELAANDAGLDNNLDEEHPLPAKRVTNRVEAHMSRTGQKTSRDRSQSGVALEDLDGGA